MSKALEVEDWGPEFLSNEMKSKCPLIHRFGYWYELFLLLCARDLVRTKLAIMQTFLHHLINFLMF